MLKSYFTIAWRNLQRNKVFSFINIFGLAIGLTCCMLLTLYIWHEASYDTYHPHINRLYQVAAVSVDHDGKQQRFAGCPHTLAEIFKASYPQVERTARICGLLSTDKTLLQYTAPGEAIRSFNEEKGFMADSGFFRLFHYDFVEGNAASAISGPYSIVLSKEIADKIFGGKPALNKVVHISSNFNGEHDYTVSGVFRPMNSPSHIDARFFLSMYGGEVGDFLRTNDNPSMISNTYFYTYLLLKEGSDPAQLEKQFPAFVDTYIGKELKAIGHNLSYFLLKVRDIHLHSNMEYGDITPSGNIAYLYILGSIGLFTLLIACINFMNLATARSTKRSAEVGVRKTLGAGRGSLVRQFLGESILMALIAFVIALCLCNLLLPAFGRLSGKTIVLSASEVFRIGSGFFVLAIFTGLLAGSYPALYLSSFKPVTVLKGKITNSLAVVSLRKGLVVFQFCISIVLIIAAVVIANQLHFLRTADLGFTKDQQLILPLSSDNAHRLLLPIKAELQKEPGILSVGASYFYPGFTGWNGLYYAEGKTRTEDQHFDINMVDFDFMKALQLKAVAGHVFSDQFPADSVDGIVLNERAMHQLGYSLATCIGKSIYHDNGQNGRFRIVGVVKDFHFEDLHRPINGLVFIVNSRPDYNFLIVHANAAKLSSTLASVRRIWHTLNPNEPCEYSFLDDQFQQHYESDNRLAVIIGYATGIAIFISCLGLFGLAAFSAEQRTKEIGIRKVLGASERSIVALLSGDFLKLVGVAVLIGTPVGWFVVQRWLQSFAYRTGVSWTLFVYTAAAALLIALLTISYQAIRAATANPVESLRSE
ncbi:MAG TPA: ABC transporter permease [Puia sp.]|nr:ABC transporter permease [Puia sp.]